MKTRFISLITLYACITLAAFADSRTVAEAQREALRFLSSGSSSAKYAPAAKSVQLAYTLPKVNSSGDAAYLFQVGEDGGYVLVSADDNTLTILGYASEGCFDANDIPENMQVWLQHYAEEIAWASQQGSRIMKADNGGVKKTAAAPIQPLLGGIVWNQGTPFWNQCPYDSDGKRCYTGCVATAATQIMRYWKFPQQGTGSHSYTWTKTDGTTQMLSADFNTTYDWNNMLENYNGNYTTTQANEVAKLMFHLGVATEMEYSSNGSGTQTAKEARALFTYFGYDKSLYKVMPDFVGFESFEEQMLTELQSGRPVLMGGLTVNNEGHAFVCDGYDGTYFHINWGWGGSQNGYFALSALDPMEQGMGGAASGAGYHVNIEGIMGIKPDAGGQITTSKIGTYGLALSSFQSVKNTDNFSIFINQMHSIGVVDYEGGFVGLGVFNDKDEFVCLFGGANIPELPVAYYYNFNWEVTGNLSGVTSDGNYYIAPVFTSLDQSEVYRMDVAYDSPQYFEFTKSGNDIIFQVEEDPTIDYSINNLSGYTDGSYIYFSFESDAPFYHVKLYYGQDEVFNTYIEFNNARYNDAADGTWTIWVCGADKYKIDRGEPVSINVTVGEVEDEENPSDYDIDGDGKVDENDVTLLRNYILGRSVPADFNTTRADINKDGKVNVADVLALVDYIRTHSDEGEDNWEFGSH